MANYSTISIKRQKSFALFLAPGIIILGLLSLVPTFLLFYLSTTDLSLVRPGSGAFVGLGTYIDMVQDQFFWESVRVTLILIIVPVTFQMLLGIAMALLLNNEALLIRWSRSFFIAPMVVAPVVAALIWKVLFFPNLGGLNYLLGLVGLPEPNWLGSNVMAIVAVSVVTIWQDTPFVMLLTLAALESIPSEPLEASIVDGANAWQQIIYVKFPFIRPVLYTAMIFRVINSLGIFPIIYVLTQGGPGRSTEVLNFYAYRQGFQYLHIGYASAIAVSILVLILCLSLGFLALRFRVREEQ